ncbi:MAG TPA: hypothetical protein VIW19_07185 [Gaiellaceae bacterium]|jgi:hypothetical protein
MRRFFLFVGLVAMLAVPAVVTAAAQTDGTLSIKRGRATIDIKLKRGTVIGSMARGTIRIRDLGPYDASIPQIRHCRLRYPNSMTIACTGKKITFRAVDGRFVVHLKGSGIFLSAVGRGNVAITGAANPNFPSNGVMSVDNGPYQAIQDFETSFALGSTTP